MKLEYSFEKINKPYEMAYLDESDGRGAIWCVNGISGEPMGCEEGKVTDFPWFLMQSTGLHDKNGKEIYEGDIVKGVEGNEGGPSEVFYGYGQWWPFAFVGIFDGGEYEVVGNIYENPELIEKVAQ